MKRAGTSCKWFAQHPCREHTTWESKQTRPSRESRLEAHRPATSISTKEARYVCNSWFSCISSTTAAASATLYNLEDIQRRK